MDLSGEGSAIVKKKTRFLGVAVIVMLMTAILLGVKNRGNKNFALGDLDTGLYVDGLLIAEKVIIHEDRDYAELPILSVVKALGYSVREIGDDSFEVAVGNRVFLLDTANGTVIDKEDPHQDNLIIPAPGQVWFYKEARDGDIYVDQESMRTVFMFMGIQATVRVAFDSERVIIISPHYT